MFRAMVVAMVVVAGGGVAHAADAQERARGFTLGAVQKDLRPGLSQAEVAERLGAPNILTRDADGSEAWVYDRISTEVEASSAHVGVGATGSGVGSTFWGMLGVGAGKRSEKARSSQRTLTVVVRFSTAGAVETFSWHDSSF